MRILLISNMYPSDKYPFFGTFVKNFHDQLKEKNNRFELVVIQGKSDSLLEKIKKYLVFFKNALLRINKNDFDLIYVHYIGHSLLPLVLVKPLIKKPLVINAHGSDVFTKSKIGFLIQKMVTPIIKMANMIVVPSGYFRSLVHEKFEVEIDKIFISPSGGVDMNIFKPQAVKEHSFTIGYVGRIDKGKGWDTLLFAVKLLKSKKLHVRVLIVGGGAQEKLLLKQIKNTGLQDIVEYVGPKPHFELAKYFNKMNVFVFPTTLNESLGLVGLEAMSCAIPVIGSNIGALPSYIKDGLNGKLFNPSDVVGLSDKIEFFMNLNEADFKGYKEGALFTSQLYSDVLVANDLNDQLTAVVKNYSVV